MTFSPLRFSFSLVCLLSVLVFACQEAPGPVVPALDLSDFAEPGMNARPWVRWDYALTISELFSERYLGTLDDWAAGRGMAHRAQVYGPVRPPCFMGRNWSAPSLWFGRFGTT